MGCGGAAALLAATLTLWAPMAGAFPFGPGGTRIVPDDALHVHGVRVEDTSSVIPVPTDRPTFHGVTVPSVRVRLSTADGIAIGATRTDPQGTWIVTAPRVLPPGRHQLRIDLEDDAGVSTGPQVEATFEVPEDIPPGTTAIETPPLSLREWNDVTLTLLVFSVAAILLIAYMLLRRRPQTA